MIDSELTAGEIAMIQESRQTYIKSQKARALILKRLQILGTIPEEHDLLVNQFGDCIPSALIHNAVQRTNSVITMTQYQHSAALRQHGT